MFSCMKLSALAMLLIPTIVLAGSEAAAKRAPPPPASGPTLVRVTKVALGTCSTDGGTEPCPSGTKYLGDVIQSYWNNELGIKPLDCPGGTAGSYTVRIGFDYNGGSVDVRDSDKAQAKWPTCVREFAKQAGAKWLEWYKVLQPIDGRIDINNEYKITVQLRK